MTFEDRKDALALFILRTGLAWFIFVWAANKVFAPKQYQWLAKRYDNVDLSLMQIYLVAAFQIALCLLVLVGAFRLFSYGGLAIMHFFTVLRRWEGFFDPFALSAKGFPINRNQVIDLAVMAGFIALLLLIHRDHFSVGGWLRRHSGARWWQ